MYNSREAEILPLFLFKQSTYFIMEIELAELINGIDNIIKKIIPHTKTFHEEVKLLSRKQELFDDIDILVKKYDDLIQKIQKENII